MLLSAIGALSVAWRVFFACADTRGSALSALPPPRFHAHNDYVHARPLFDALGAGARSIEADIWLVDGQLLVGHDAHDLRPERTLASLYLDPLRALLEAHNGSSDGLPTLPLQLLVDIKTDGPATFPHLHAALAPLRSAGLLSTHVPGMPRLSASLLTVVGTGNTPAPAVAAAHPRDVFLDADLAAPLPLRALAPLASASLAHVLGSWYWLPVLARPRVRALVRAAHKQGVEARVWGVPRGPRVLRMYVQRMLRAEGVDWLNVDDWAELRALGG